MKRRAAHKGWEGFFGQRISFFTELLVLWEFNTIQGASLLWYSCAVVHGIVWICDHHKCGRKISNSFEKLALLRQPSACFTMLPAGIHLSLATQNAVTSPLANLLSQHYFRACHLCALSDLGRNKKMSKDRTHWKAVPMACVCPKLSPSCCVVIAS